MSEQRWTIYVCRNGHAHGDDDVESFMGKACCPWDVPSRPRVDKHPLQERLRWEAA